MKDMLKCATIMSGALCVIGHGMILMLKLLADRLVSLGQVMVFFTCNSYGNGSISFNSMHVLIVFGFTVQTAVDAIAKSNAYFGRGTGRIWLNRLDCLGHEENLFNCYQSAIGSNFCWHRDDAGVTCRSKLYMSFFAMMDYIT